MSSDKTNYNSHLKLKKRRVQPSVLRNKANDGEYSPSHAFDVTRLRSYDTGSVISRIKQGIQFDEIRHLQTALNATLQEISILLGISPSTLSRRKKEGYLNTIESDRLVRFARLRDKALELMQGNNEAAVVWLRSPQKLLYGESALDLARTEFGAHEVEDLIGRLKYGVFS